jgi:hypothetical protein
LISDCFEQCRLFFAQSPEIKNVILADRNNRGYTPYQEEKLSPGTQTEGDTKEGLYFGREIGLNDAESQKPLHGPNQWPDPDVLPAFRPAVEAYFEACHALGIKCAAHPTPFPGASVHKHLAPQTACEGCSKPQATQHPTLNIQNPNTKQAHCFSTPLTLTIIHASPPLKTHTLVQCSQKQKQRHGAEGSCPPMQTCGCVRAFPRGRPNMVPVTLRAPNALPAAIALRGAFEQP